MIKDTDTFTRLYSEVMKDLYRLALYFLKNKEDAEDIVGEAVLDAYRQMQDDAERIYIKQGFAK